MSSVCNNDCICIDSDCAFLHPVSLQERKIYKKLYDKLNNPIKTEPNNDTRKANCKFGKICNNSKCGYRHRLCYNDRLKLKEAFDNTKLDATKTKKEPIQIIVNPFLIENKNLFETLDIEEVKEIKEEKKVVLSWADICDDDFLMTF
jgi:hypothetical protein